MTIDTFTGFTDYDWSDDSRPELRLTQSGLRHIATLTLGRDVLVLPVIELTGMLDEVISELESYAEIFQAAVAHLRGAKIKAELSRDTM